MAVNGGPGGEDCLWAERAGQCIYKVGRKAGGLGAELGDQQCGRGQQDGGVVQPPVDIHMKPDGQDEDRGNLNQNLRDGGLTWGIAIQAGKRKYVEPIQILILSLLHQML